MCTLTSTKSTRQLVTEAHIANSQTKHNTITGKFKIGDLLRCISMDNDYNDKLTIGGFYTVIETGVGKIRNRPWVRVSENNGENVYGEHCFELIPEFKVGDLVERISSTHLGIHMGETFIIKGIRPSFCGTYFWIKADRGTGDREHHSFNCKVITKEFQVIKFKIGDKVVYKDFTNTEPHKNMTNGQIYRVVGAAPSWVRVYDNNGEEYGFNSKNFTLALPETPEQLFEMFKVGLQAHNALIENGLLQFRDNGAISFITKNTKSSKEYRLKPKEKLIPFELAGHRIYIDNNDLVIGCQKFDFSSFRVSLEALLNGDAFESSGLISYRQGIRYKNHKLSWDDAQDLYDKIKDIKI